MGYLMEGDEGDSSLHGIRTTSYSCRAGAQGIRKKIGYLRIAIRPDRVAPVELVAENSSTMHHVDTIIAKDLPGSARKVGKELERDEAACKRP